MKQTITRMTVMLMTVALVGVVQAQTSHQKARGAESPSDSVMMHGDDSHPCMMHAQKDMMNMMRQGGMMKMPPKGGMMEMMREGGMMKISPKGGMREMMNEGGMMNMSPKGGMMNMMHQASGMMGSAMAEMMKVPVHNVAASIFVLPALASNLELSSEQVDDLNELKNNFLDRQENAAKDLATEGESLSRFFLSENFSPDDIEDRMIRTARLQARRMADIFKTEVVMKAVLTTEQTELFDSTERQEIHRRIMSSLSMGDMMQMMEIMQCDMMSDATSSMMMDKSTRHALMGMMPGLVVGKEKMGSMDGCPMHDAMPHGDMTPEDHHK